MDFRLDGQHFGTHRVLSPAGALPQAAEKLDSTGPAWDNELVIDVETLNVDSASFHQIVGAVGEDENAVAGRILEIVGERGKMQNPVTGSGGMLIGTVMAKGPRYGDSVEVGDRIATLVSLTLTPLDVRNIRKVHLRRDQVDVEATAYLTPSAPVVKLPEDLPAKLALSVLDVCGAPAQAQRLCKGARSVLILGAGKSGLICAAAAREVMGLHGSIYAIDLTVHHLEELVEAELIDLYASADATDPMDVLETILALTGGELVDVVINTCNVPKTELSAILSCRDRGKVYFFNMATDFARAALGAEGVGKDVDLLIGNGYAQGHAELALDIVRRHPSVRAHFEGDA
jgi:L-erythro-3,5-diaminohexanoate dehydrogenase